MYILTHHYSLLAISASDGTLKQVASLLPEEGHKLINLEPEDVARLHAADCGPGARGVIISSGALAAYEYVEGHAAGSFSLFKEGIRFRVARRGQGNTRQKGRDDLETCISSTPRKRLRICKSLIREKRHWKREQ